MLQYDTSKGEFEMYTEENMDYNNNYDENNYVENNYEDNKNGSIWTLLLRILIIFVCLLLVIWLISKFIGGKDKEKGNDGVIFNNNISAIRLASEKYFFMENNLPENENQTVTISLFDMNNNGLVEVVYDYQDKVCSTNTNESYATLTKTSVAYELTIKLTCEQEQKEVTYYYDLQDYECLSCNGNTYMDGNLVLDDNNDDQENNQQDNSEIDNNDEEANLNINCDTWSEWTTLKLTDEKLLVRTRVLYKGYLPGGTFPKVTYSEWSEWSETPVTPSETLEVEIKQEIKGVETWSANKTTTNYSSIEGKIASGDIKVINQSTSSSGGYYKEITKTGEVSASKFASLNSQGLIVNILDTYYKTDCSEDCETCYTKVYKVTYKEKKWVSGSSVTTYTYQEKLSTSQTINLYRYRIVTKENVTSENTYIDWVETLPEGYIKTEEKIEYSYKDTSCKG